MSTPTPAPAVRHPTPLWDLHGQWWAMSPPYDVVHLIVWADDDLLHARCGIETTGDARRDPADDAIPCRLCWERPRR